MPSQPDRETAHRLNPDRFPLDADKALEQEQLVSGYLAQKLAKLDGTQNAEKFLVEARAAAEGAKPPKIADKTAPKEEASGNGLNETNASYFANKNGDTFYPIEMKGKNPFNRMKDENVLYFETPEAAEEANFVAHDKPDDEEDTDEEDDTENEDETDEEETEDEEDKE